MKLLKFIYDTLHPVTWLMYLFCAISMPFIELPLLTIVTPVLVEIWIRLFNWTKDATKPQIKVEKFKYRGRLK